MWPFKKKLNSSSVDSDQKRPRQELPELPQRQLIEKEAWDLLFLLNPFLGYSGKDVIKLTLDEAQILRDYATLQLNLTELSSDTFAIFASWKQIFNRTDIYLKKAEGSLKGEYLRIEDGILMDFFNIIMNIAIYRFHAFILESIKPTYDIQNAKEISESIPVMQEWLKDFKECLVDLDSKDCRKIQAGLLQVPDLFKKWPKAVLSAATNKHEDNLEKQKQQREAAEAVSMIGYYKVREDALKKTKDVTGIDVDEDFFKHTSGDVTPSLFKQAFSQQKNN